MSAVFGIWKRLGLKVKLLTILSVLGILVASVFSVIAYRRAVEMAQANAESRAQELLARSAEMFLVSTRKFHDGFEKSKGDPQAQKQVVADWSRTIFAVDEAVIADLGKDNARVRLIGDKEIFGFQPLGGSNTKIETSFEREASRRLAGGEPIVKSIEGGYLRVAAPLPSQAHRGCAECHFSTLESVSADMTRNVVLGSLNAYVPLAGALATARSDASFFAVGLAVAMGFSIVGLFVLLIFTVIRPVFRCKESVTALANQDFGKKCLVTSQDEIGQMAQAINASIDTTQKAFDGIQEKIYFYETILNTIPHPVSVTDKDMHWTFVNKTALDIAQLKKEDVLGKHCSNWGADICNTDRCGVCMAKANGGKATSYFTQPQFPGMEFKVDGTVMYDRQGKPMGHIEVIQDITADNQLKKYRETEVRRVARNLEELSKGNLDFSTQVAEGNQYTTEARGEFAEISQALDRTIVAVRRLVADADALAAAAVAGNLGERANPESHSGEFRRIIEGVNRMFDSVVTPLRAAATALESMARKDFTRSVSGQFRGEYEVLIRNVNDVVSSIKGAISEITESAAQFAEGARVVADNSQTLAQGSQTQSSAVEEMGESIEALASSVGAVKDNAQTANDLARPNQRPGPARGLGRPQVGRGYESHPRQFSADQRDHPGDLGNRQSDEPAGLERCDRSRPRRRARHGLCRRGRRGPQTGRAIQPGRPRDLLADQGIDEARRGRIAIERRDRQIAAADHRRGRADRREDRRNRGRHGEPGVPCGRSLEGHPRGSPGLRASRRGKRRDGLQQRGTRRPGSHTPRSGGNVQGGRLTTIARQA